MCRRTVMESQGLTNEEVLALDKILVKDNRLIVALHFESGYYGRGGSNNSSFTEEINTTKTLDELTGQPLLKIFGVQICAVVNDVVYYTWENRANGEVLSFDAKGRYTDECGIAYDTMRGWLICPVLK